MPTISPVPIQHGPGTCQFKCTCGEVVTFAPNSVVYPRLVNAVNTSRGVKAGNFPFCGQRHWYGTHRKETS